MTNQWYAICPLGVYSDPEGRDIKRRFLSSRVYIDRIPGAFLSPESMKLLSESAREELESSAAAFIAEYTASAVGSPDPKSNDDSRSIQETVTEEVMLASLACWLSRPTALNAGGIYHFRYEPGYIVFRQSRRGARFIVADDEVMNCLDVNDIDHARVILEKISLLAHDSTVWSAVHMLHKSLTERMWPVRFLLQWLVLECLFGTDGLGEISYQLAQRIGFFLSETRMEARSIYQRAKNSYNWRGKIVHGLRLEKMTPEKSTFLMRDLEDLVRKTLTKILLDDAKTNLFNSNARSDKLGELVFDEIWR